MQTSMISLNRNNYQTYLFVGLCWLFPITIVSLTIGPVQWLNQWATQHHWSANYRFTGLIILTLIIALSIVFLTKYTTRLLFQTQEISSPIHKGLWIFLTLSCIASLSWLVYKPELFNAISQSLAYIPLR
ncbi:hypothetical protein [Flavobacterium sp. N1719]|uniref:hypothetical protein n=1 Tax=Flavobacterium sp. N1719 TaxID=2885633 RepID=UPI00222220F8|nr:hypothetical protein [Flavobacterium sp. N1719]